jgi:hypothetical protein
VGVTEAGLSSKDTMKDLYDLLHLFCILRQDGTWTSHSKIFVVDMDNAPHNGDRIAASMNEWAAAEHEPTRRQLIQDFLAHQVVCANTMVDRITSQRGGGGGGGADDAMVPRCEPLPAKALVVLDPLGDWPILMTQNNPPGVVVRSTPAQFDWDVALKLRIANGTHTAIAHTLALLGFLETNVLSATSCGGSPASSSSSSTIFIRYLDALVHGQIIHATSSTHQAEAKAVYKDWRRRLMHPHFGLSTFFITQNGPAKGGIRLGPTVVDLISKGIPLQVGMAFAYAALLRWLTPVGGEDFGSETYTGWLDRESKLSSKNDKSFEGAVTYADGLRYHLEQGWYEYKCPLRDGSRPLVESLRACVGREPAECLPAIRSYLMAPEGGNLQRVASSIDDLAGAIAVLYARLVAGDGLLEILQELETCKYDIAFDTPCSLLAEGRPSKSSSFLEYHPHSIPENSVLMKRLVDLASVESVVTAEVQGVVVIDLHTHLLPPTHGSLCLWGIDELLTYVSPASMYMVVRLWIMFPLRPPNILCCNSILIALFGCRIFHYGSCIHDAGRFLCQDKTRTSRFDLASPLSGPHPHFRGHARSFDDVEDFGFGPGDSGTRFVGHSCVL